MSTDNTKEAMPFNDHTPLPWEVNPHGPVICHRDLNEQGLRRTRWVAEVNNQQDSQADAAFIVHACNTYYDREQARQQDKARIEELTKALAEAVAIIDSQIGRSTSTQAKKFLRRRIDPLRAIITPYTTKPIEP